MNKRDPKKEKLDVLMKTPGKDYDCTTVSKKYWDKIWEGVLDYLVMLGFIKVDQKEELKYAISDYIRHSSPKGPQPQWGNP